MTYFEEAFLALAFLFEDIFVLRFIMENQKFLTPPLRNVELVAVQLSDILGTRN